MGEAARRLNDNDNTEPKSLKGKKNIYVCRKCQGHIVTVDRDDGTTPFLVTCQATLHCDGTMQSSMYRVFDQSMRATHEWYKPTILEIGQLSPAVTDHVMQGGLLLRLISTSAPLKI